MNNRLGLLLLLADVVRGTVERSVKAKAPVLTIKAKKPASGVGKPSFVESFMMDLRPSSK